MNTLKETETNTPDRLNVQSSGKKSKISRAITSALSGRFLTRDGLVSHLPFIAFLAGLFLLHITITYFFENTERNKVKVSRELQELQSEFNTINSKLQIKRQQSSISEELSPTGLKDLEEPPHFIDVKEGFFEAQD